MRARNPLVFVVVVSLLLALAASAHAAVQKVRQSPAAVRPYWTPERMRNAIPADRVRGGSPPAPAAKGGKPGGGRGGATKTSPFTTLLVDPLDQLDPPVSANGRVFFTDGAFSYTCSGTSVRSTNENVVLTAGHCVNEGPGDFFTKWVFVPAYSNGEAPKGSWTASALATTAGWETAGEFGVDVGAAVVDDLGGQTLAGAVGARQVAFGTDRDQPYTTHGYPAEGRFKGERLYVSKTRWALDDPGPDPDTMAIQTDFNGGSSGGSWIVGNQDQWRTDASAPVVSVNSYTYRSLKNYMFGPHLEDAAQKMLGDLSVY